MDISRVGIIIPAFNECLTISNIVKLSSCYGKTIVVDDGSTDKTRMIVDNFIDPRIKKIYLDNNQGLASARRELVREAAGKYIAFLDADDIADEKRLEIQVDYLKNNKNVDICGADHFTLDVKTGRKKISKQLHADVDIRALLTVSSPLCNPSVMARAEIFKSFPYDSRVTLAEDYGMWVQLALAGYHFANLPQKLITYRLHVDQISKKESQSSHIFFDELQSIYLNGLGVPSFLYPRQMGWRERIIKGPCFLQILNSKIKRISFSANYQIYARFQFRHNGIFTPFTRLERMLGALVATISGRFNHNQS
jgi:glycosyltransferase involved in cell wall biosynthesis